MATSFGGWGGSWGNSWGAISSDPNAMVGSASFAFTQTATATATGQLSGSSAAAFAASAAVTAVGQLSGSASITFGGTGDLTSASGSVDVKVSWLQLDTSATPCDVRVSWVCWDTQAQPSGFSQEVEIKRWYIKRKKQILVFNSAQEADDYLEALKQAEKAVEAAQKTSRRARQRLRNKLVTVKPIETVDIDLLSQAVEHFAIPVDLPSIIDAQDFQRFMQILAIARDMQDEEDIELLLLA